MVWRMFLKFKRHKVRKWKEPSLTISGWLFVGVILVSLFINIDRSILRGYVVELHRSLNDVRYILSVLEAVCLESTDNKVDGSLTSRMIFHDNIEHIRTCHLPVANIRTLAVVNCYAASYVIESYCKNGLMREIEDVWSFQYPNASSNDARLLAEYGVEWIVVDKRNRSYFDETNFQTFYEFETSGNRRFCLVKNLKCVGRSYIVHKGSPDIRKAEIVKDEPREVVIRAASKDGNDVLVLSDNWYPDWHAYVNEEEVEINMHKGHMLSVRLRKGQNIVRFVYSSSLVRLSAILSLASFLIAALVFLFGFKHREEPKQAEEGIDKSH